MNKKDIVLKRMEMIFDQMAMEALEEIYKEQGEEVYETLKKYYSNGYGYWATKKFNEIAEKMDRNGLLPIIDWKEND